MPTEFRFDDLDLREEPASEKFSEMDGYTNACSAVCTQTCQGTKTCSTAYC
ncbi:MAG: hypothetical protein QOI11_2823 [Candidatus Eremiobacteraeota bacterium]|jgi:hypothetical protein|nr:hypothetical protein [Candidatus Eremiobacteraeota bacterium]